MKFTYNINKKNLRREFIKNHQRINLFYIILISILFFVSTYNSLMNNFFIFISIYAIYMIFLALIFFVSSIIYSNILVKRYNKKVNQYGEFVVNFNEQGILINKDKEIKWENISDISFSKNIIIIRDNDSNELCINRNFLIDKNVYPEIEKFLRNKKKK